jgi:hypothetical protein
MRSIPTLHSSPSGATISSAILLRGDPFDYRPLTRRERGRDLSRGKTQLHGPPLEGRVARACWPRCEDRVVERLLERVEPVQPRIAIVSQASTTYLATRPFVCVQSAEDNCSSVCSGKPRKCKQTRAGFRSRRTERD